MKVGEDPVFLHFFTRGKAEAVVLVKAKDGGAVKADSIVPLHRASVFLAGEPCVKGSFTGRASGFRYSEYL